MLFLANSDQTALILGTWALAGVIMLSLVIVTHRNSYRSPLMQEEPKQTPKKRRSFKVGLPKIGKSKKAGATAQTAAKTTKAAEPVAAKAETPAEPPPIPVIAEAEPKDVEPLTIAAG